MPKQKKPNKYKYVIEIAWRQTLITTIPDKRKCMYLNLCTINIQNIFFILTNIYHWLHVYMYMHKNNTWTETAGTILIIMFLS